MEKIKGRDVEVANKAEEEINEKIFPIRAHGGKDIGKLNIDDFIKFIKSKSSEMIKEF